MCFSHDPEYNTTAYVPKSSGALQNMTRSWWKIGELVVHPMQVTTSLYGFFPMNTATVFTVKSAWTGITNNFPDVTKAFYDDLDLNSTDEDTVLENFYLASAYCESVPIGAHLWRFVWNWASLASC